VRTVALISLVYDVSAGLALLLAPGLLPSVFGVPVPEPRFFGQLNGLFLLMVGVGYLLPYREPVRARMYMWIFGVGLKTAGAIVFVMAPGDPGAPRALWVFAAGDAVMAALSMAALRSKTVRV
jgi:hypothetical protein